MSVPRARLLDLMKVRHFQEPNQSSTNHSQARCEVFATNYNPDGVRMGNKVLRQRLRGPALASWYPRKTVGVSDVMKLHPKLTTWNDKEQDRREYIEEYDIEPFVATRLDS